MLFGITGILMNHRAVLRIPAATVEQTVIQLALPEPPPDPETFAVWLQRELRLTRRPSRVKVDPARTVAWAGHGIRQPPRWEVHWSAPQRSIAAEYWVGNSFVTVRRADGNVWAFLTGLHTATGATVAWVLLTDSIAGSVIALAVTGVLLWTRLHGPTLAAAGLALGSLLLGAWFAWTGM